MKKLRYMLMVLFCAALLFLLHYVWLRPPAQFTATSGAELFKTQGEGITWRRYRDEQIVQQVSARQATLFFATATEDGAELDFGASPVRIELQGEVLFASEGHVLRTTRATFAQGVVFSDAAVQIEGGSMRLHGHDGFSYVLADRRLTLRGEVEGEAYPADRTR